MAYPDALPTNKTTSDTGHTTDHNTISSYINSNIVAAMRAVITAGTGSGALPWTNMPAAVTELDGSTAYRTVVDARGFTHARMVVSRGSVSSASTAVLRAQYSINAGSSWSNLSGDLSINFTSSAAAGTFAAIPADSKIESLLVRVVGEGGNGVADPNFTNITVEFARVAS